jgi:hypothetical protein
MEGTDIHVGLTGSNTHRVSAASQVRVHQGPESVALPHEELTDNPKTTSFIPIAKIR